MRAGLASLLDLPGPSQQITGAQFPRFGAIAQLGERVVRNDEVGGSIPPGSTNCNQLFSAKRQRPSAMPVTRTPYIPPPKAAPVFHYEDSHLIIVEKPHGLLSVPGRGPEKADCLEARIRLLHTDTLTVHRLDMETSGLVLFALGPDMQRSLSKLFETRRVEKTYIADVHGEPVHDEGLIDLPLAADWPNRPKQKADVDGKPAMTRWKVVERAPNHTRLALFPVTGRTHQLRVHLATIGHPILGDTLYGEPDSQMGADRLLLHASRLRFTHPVSGGQIDVASPAPF